MCGFGRFNTQVSCRTQAEAEQLWHPRIDKKLLRTCMKKTIVALIWQQYSWLLFQCIYLHPSTFTLLYVTWTLCIFLYIHKTFLPQWNDTKCCFSWNSSCFISTSDAYLSKWKPHLTTLVVYQAKNWQPSMNPFIHPPIESINKTHVSVLFLLLSDFKKADNDLLKYTPYRVATQ